jgi:Beta/Gamma crystallin
MKQILRHFLLAITVFAAGSAMADITFFDGENFGGRQLMLDRVTPNFAPLGFNDRAESAIVDGRSWEVCVDANFGGGCTVLPPGRYPNLGGMSGRISSARPVGGPPVAMPPPVPMPPSGMPPSGAIIFYDSDNFSGRQFSINQPVGNFAGSRYNDRARSAIVEGGPWEICTDAEFRGDCRIFVPGRYPDLGGLGGRVSSARPSYEPRGGPPGRMRGGRGASATLFSGPNMTGRAFPIGSDGTSNLDGMFNDRASSLRVDSGYWIFCSDANFRGECRTFGPGEYPVLPPELNDRVSSGRRISNDYPYNQNPNWR